jgi:LmbE family N-acetylglucosaminyl deacetylase
MDIFGNIKRVMVFGAHGDDEIIGPGATLYGLSQKGIEIVVVTFTNRETAYARIEDKEKAILRAEKEMAAADEILGIKERVVLGLPNQGVVNDRNNFQSCTKLIRKYRPEIIFTHVPHDNHRDHRAVAELIDEARSKAGENLSPDWGAPHTTDFVLYFEIFNMFTNPHIIAPIENSWLEKKLEAMRSQASQLEVFPRMESHIKGLALVRGAAIGSHYGEAFRISDFHSSRAHV